MPTHEIRLPGTKKHVEILKTTPFLKKIPKFTKVYEVVVFSLFPLEKVLFPFKRSMASKVAKGPLEAVHTSESILRPIEETGPL